MSVERFDHESSPTVDVRKNQTGEFIQVWNLPFKTQGRKLLLSYQRDGNNISDINKITYFENGTFSCISEREEQKTYTYRDNKRAFRIETTLSNGYLLVDDDREQLSTEYIYCLNFDYNTKTLSKKLSDKAVVELQKNKCNWYRVIYQISQSIKELVATQEYCGNQLVSEEFYISVKGN